MPNTKSAARRARNSARKHAQNHSAKARLHTLEKRYLEAVRSGKSDDATTSFRLVSSALDKAAKSGVIPKRRSDRKKSRLANRLLAPKASQQPASTPAA
jgi:small subunit ribosomal protein S20